MPSVGSLPPQAALYQGSGPAHGLGEQDPPPPGSPLVTWSFGLTERNCAVLSDPGLSIPGGPMGEGWSGSEPPPTWTKESLSGHRSPRQCFIQSRPYIRLASGPQHRDSLGGVWGMAAHSAHIRGLPSQGLAPKARSCPLLRHGRSSRPLSCHRRPSRHLPVSPPTSCHGNGDVTF